MAEVITTINRCKSCGFCVKHCPKDAISFSTSFNRAGYKYAVVDPEKCVVCGTCYLVCPDGVLEIKE